jgi:hypothetical protein
MSILTDRLYLIINWGKKRLRPSKTQLLWAKSYRYKTANIKIERQRKNIEETT